MKDITNKEFQQILQQFPENAIIAIEYCNPKKVRYDSQHNIIHID